MLAYIVETTRQFLEDMPKRERKKKGQFFTSYEAAVYMAGLFTLPSTGELSVLDPGAGSGILAAAFVDRVQRETQVKKITLTCYETDALILPLLEMNLDHLQKHSGVDVDYRIMTEDYLLSQADDFEETMFASAVPPKYDFVIGNPPYLRIMKYHPAARSMPRVIHGAPNLYFLFAAMSLFNLKDSGEMVYIMPRSWTSGLYFTMFRKYFLQHGKLEHIHLFVRRDKVFSHEQVLQETMIVKAKKTQRPVKYVTLTSSESNEQFYPMSEICLPYDGVVVGSDRYVFLPVTPAQVEIVRRVNRYQCTLPDIGIKMKTGIVVDFRQYDDLRPEKSPQTVPLFYSQNIKDGRVHHEPSGKTLDWVTMEKPGLLQDNKDYVFCKRFTAKEERRRLQCGIYLAADFPMYDKISTQNKINFIERVDGEKLSPNEIYGIFALLNSTLFDMYYRILNGSTQVNSTEVNTIPVPPLRSIQKIGQRLRASRDLSTDNCDKILSEVAYG